MARVRGQPDPAFRALVADDDAGVRSFVSEALRQMGFLTADCTNGAVALAEATASGFTVLLQVWTRLRLRIECGGPAPALERTAEVRWVVAAPGADDGTFRLGVAFVPSVPEESP